MIAALGLVCTTWRNRELLFVARRPEPQPPLPVVEFSTATRLPEATRFREAHILRFLDRTSVAVGRSGYVQDLCRKHDITLKDVIPFEGLLQSRLRREQNMLKTVLEHFQIPLPKVKK